MCEDLPPPLKVTLPADPAKIFVVVVAEACPEEVKKLHYLHVQNSRRQDASQMAEAWANPSTGAPGCASPE